MRINNRIIRNLPEWAWLHKVSAYSIKSGWPLILSEAVIGISGLATAYAFTHWSSQQSYGAYKYITTIFGILAVFSIPGVNTAVTQAVAAGVRGLLLTAIYYRISWSLFASVIAAIIGAWFYLHGQQNLVPAMLLGAAILPICYAPDTILSFLNGKLAYRSLATIKAISSFSAFLVVVIILLLSPEATMLLVSGSLLIPACVLLAAIFIALRTYPEERNTTPHPVPLKFGFQLTWRGLIGTIEGKLDLLIVGTFFSLEQLAIFSVGKIFRDVLARLWGLVATLLLPKLSSKTKITRSLTARLLVSLCGLFTIIVALAAISAPWLIPLVFSRTYSDSIFYAQSFAGLTAIGTIGAVLEAQFTAQRLIRPLLLTRIVTTISYAVGLVILVPLWGLPGIIGALYFRATSYSISCVILWIRNSR